MPRWVAYGGLLMMGLVLISGCLSPPRSDKPAPASPAEKLVTSQDGYGIYQQDNRILLVKKNDQVDRFNIADSDLELAYRLSSKPSGQPPLIDKDIESAVVLSSQQKHYVIQLKPEVKLLQSYPRPQVSTGRFIRIEKQANRLYLFEDGWLRKTYAVSTGKMPWYTPEGTFRVVNQMPYPKGRDPQAPMGTRWMGLAIPVERDRRGNKWDGGPDPRSPVGQKFGIHGTNDESTIGTHASGGCIRMYNHSVNELYDLVDIGTPVQIVP